MIRQFINRKSELDLLDTEWSHNYSFVVIYGKRRVGKTELIRQFTKDKPSLIYIFPEASMQIQINEMKGAIASYFKDTVLPKIEISDWYVLFDYLAGLVRDKQCIVLDEFTYGIKSDRKILSDLQRIIDTKLKDKDVMIIVSGSLLGMVHEDILNDTSPLYGRRTRDLLIEDLGFSHAKKFWDIDFSEFVKFYMAIGGVPQYNLIASNYSRFGKFIEAEFLNKNGYFFREVYFIMSQELRDIKIYFSILQMIASGYTRPSEIANNVGKDTRELYPYFDNLIRLGYIRKETPVIGKGSGVYRLNDFLFDFWFNTVYRYREQIELQDTFKISESALNAYFGRKFEDVSKQFLIRKKPFEFTRISRQWGHISGVIPGKNAYEIDLVALNDDTKEIGFFECKWQDLSYKQALGIIEDLKKKSAHVPVPREWNSSAGAHVRRQYFGILAKKIRGKDKLNITIGEKETICAFDLDDFSELE